MDEMLQRAVAALPGHTCVASKGNKLYVSDARGIRPLLDWLEQVEEPLRNASVADKVVGKAAALLFVYGGVREVYAAVLSEAAAAALDMHGIPYSCDRMVPRIINRDGTGLCPMESRVMDTDTPQEALLRLREAIAAMQKQPNE